MSVVLIVILAKLSLAACTDSSDDAVGRRLPSDLEVIEDVTPNDTENVVEVQVVPGKSGESYLHPDTLAWALDRGAVINRAANIAGAPKAVVVRGLARYPRLGENNLRRMTRTRFSTRPQ